MNIVEAREFIKNVNWVYAKTYSKTFPHEYITRKTVNNDKLFESFIEFIRDNSVIKSFYSKQYLYLDIDGFGYWEMGRPLKAIQVINKGPIDDTKPYRFPAPKEGDRDLLLNRLKERDIYLDKLLSKKDKTEEDQFEILFLMNSERGSDNILDNSHKETKSYKI